MAGQAARGDAYAATAGKKLKDEMIAEEQRTMREVQKKYRLDDEKERQKKEDHRKALVEAMEINREMGEKRRMQQQQEKERDRELKLKYQNDNRIEDERQRKIAQEKSMRIKEMRDALDEQVLFRMSGKRNESSLTPLEISTLFLELQDYILR